MEAAAGFAACGQAIVFLGHFADFPDPRQRGKVIYPLNEVLLLCLLAVLAGAETFVDKYEEVYLRAYENVSEARASIGRYLDFYNGRRPHSSLDGTTPDQAYFTSLPFRLAA